MNKKGAIELQLNWILVLIIGGLILFFFIAIVAKQKDITDLQVSGELVKDLDSLISGAQSATGGSSIIPIPNERLEFSCNEYTVKNQRLPLRSRVVFGSSVIEEGEGSVLVWSLDWKIPYKVTDFLFITAPSTKYVFAYDESEATKYEDFIDNFVSDKLEKEKAIVGVDGFIDFEDTGSDKIRVIVFANRGFELPEFAYGEGTSAVQFPFFDPRINQIADRAKFYFYDRDQDNLVLQGESSYINKESLIGAIFVENVFDYSCIMEKAWRNLHAINKVQWERAKLLRDSNVCSICYDDELMENYEKIDSSTANSQDWSNKVAEVYSAAQILDRKNSNIEKLSMPLIH